MDRTFRNLLILIGLTITLIHVVAYSIVNEHLESWWWVVFMGFMGLNMMFACASHTLDHPALEGAVGRLYLRFKISHTWIYITDPKGNRNNQLFAIGFIEHSVVKACCWNITCLTFSFSIGILPKRNRK